MFGRRRDGTLAKVAPYRRIMPFLMRGRNESMVLFEQHLDMSRAQPWLAAWEARTGPHATAVPLLLPAPARALHEARHPHRFPAGESFAEMVAALTTDIRIARSDALSKVDKELGFFLRLPGFLLAASVGLLRWLDSHGMAPFALIGDDPLYTSAFIANLGSLKIDAAYHHLYEYGNCPLFCTVGRLATAPIIVDGAVEARPSLLLRYSYDERGEDGFYAASAIAKVRGWIEDPASSIE